MAEVKRLKHLNQSYEEPDPTAPTAFQRGVYIPPSFLEGDKP